MGNIILVVIVCLIGIVSIFNLTVGKRNRASADARNRDVFGTLRDRATDEFGSSRFEEMKKIPFMSDSGNGFILCADEKADIMALVTYDGIYRMKYKSEKSCEVIVEGDSKTFERLSCIIRAPELDNDAEIVLASRHHRRNGFIGKAIMQDAEQMKSVITEGIKEN